MELHLSAISEAIALVNRLKTELEVLYSVLQASVDHVEVHAIYGMEFRHDNAVHDADPIVVRQLEGAEAVEAAFEALTCITLKIGQSPKETLRVPGAIALPRLAIDKIVQTNALRNELATLIGTIKKTNDRRLVWKKFQDISPKQAMRSTHVLDDPQNINFYWDDTGSSGTRHSAGELIEDWEELLNQNHDRRPTMDGAPEGSIERTLLVAIDLLSKLDPNEQVAIRRPVKPHIRARVRDGDDKVKPIICPVPFVYEIGCPRPKIKPLLTYEPCNSSKKATGRALLELEPHIESMNLYRYEEKYREYGPLRNKKAGPQSTHADTEE
ncbi:hypothetical protein H8F21_15650 [Pseudomonas sp. P66]|uniref:DNA replication terminus site-binding protein n=1 Tax=Pseudomonas arcuscaelestis TaxID=2710591 RepID=A0ABS2BZE2_9PSED|nr:DNA replication terminus site-binding protein [Pseudomonas arcuscaelestis]MBM5459002.1 hypothetical protein [Pseudomonas arcuscaelestis]